MAYVLQAIVTKYIGPSNTKGSRITARAAAGRIVVPYEHDLGIEANHAAAAKALADKMGWRGTYYQGGMPSGSGYVFVSLGYVEAYLKDRAGSAFTTEGKSDA